MTAMAEASAGRRDGSGGYVLRDYTAVERLDVSPEDVRALARYYDDAPGRVAPALVAVVAARAADYGMARMWEIIAEDTGAYGEAHVAWSRADAVGWLVAHGVPAEELQG
jgi:hypothetical protein